MKTLGVSEKVHKDFMNIKINYGFKKTDKLLEEMIKDFRKGKLLEVSSKFRNRMKEKNITLKKLMEKSRRIREDIYNEWF